MKWPDWCSWELELTPHLLKRMVDRQFNEADLRLMLENATDTTRIMKRDASSSKPGTKAMPGP